MKRMDRSGVTGLMFEVGGTKSETLAATWTCSKSFSPTPVNEAGLEEDDPVLPTLATIMGHCSFMPLLDATTSQACNYLGNNLDYR
jgi:hypothetical protein